MLMFWIFTLLLLHNSTCQLRTNFWLKKMTACNKTFPTPVSINITSEGDKQFADLKIKFLGPLDRNVGADILIENSLDGNHYGYLFRIQEKNTCNTLNKYMGEFWYDLERAMQIPAGLCPIRQGWYRAHHHYLDFKKVTLQTFPFGFLRFTFNFITNNNGSCLLCLIFEVENKLQF